MQPPHHVVIVGGGFGGLAAARALKRAPVEVTLTDKRNFHLFQPLLYQVATGALSPANISAPLRWILRRQKNATVVLGEVVDVDLGVHRVVLNHGVVPFDSLIVATGARHSYFGADEWERFAPGLKTIEDATEIRRRLLLAFEAAELENDPDRRAAWMTFVVVGAGPTGVELAGAVAELSHHTLKHDFRRIDPAAARVILLDAADRVLPPYPENLSARTAASLAALDVEVRTGARVTSVTADEVEIEIDGQREVIRTRTILWAAGVEASPLARRLARAAGVETDRAGRIAIGADLTLPGHPEVMILGDMAACTDAGGRLLPGVAPVAVQQGKYAATVIRRRLEGRSTPPFRYRDPGMMATIGRSSAVAVLRGRHFSGMFAWLMWLFVHLMQLVDFKNRLLVMVQWAWSYTTWNRSARLITGSPADRRAPAGVDEPLHEDDDLPDR